MSMKQTPTVSVILVNYRGVTDTLEALSYLRSVQWPSEYLEIIVVDNNSNDGSVELLRSEADITVVASPANVGFAGGCNLGVTKSSGTIVAFLNNDARPDPEWITHAVAAFDQSARVGAVASTVLSWDGKTIDYQGAGMTWYGMGYRPLTGTPVGRKKPPQPHEVLFGTGSAMFVKRDVFEQLGGFDERFFMFFEDVDFGWRLNLAGWSFVHEPRSIAFHKFHQSMSSIPQFQEQFLLERNALFALIKNLGEDKLPTVLAATLLASTKRALTKAGVDSAQFDLAQGVSTEATITIPADALVPSFAMDQVAEALPGLMASRAEIQRTRKKSDAAIWRLFGSVDAAMSTDRKYLRGYDKIVEAFRVTDDPKALAVLVITGDPIGPNMSGPGIRAWNIASELSKYHDVTLMTLSELNQVVTSGFSLEHVSPGDEKSFKPWERWADVIVFQGHALDVFHSLATSAKRLVIDVYDPMHFEQLEQSRHLGEEEWSAQVTGAAATMERQFLRGDFFLCATERQKHLYLGQLMTLGRITTQTYQSDPHLEKLIGVVPFGLPEEPLVATGAALRGVVPGIRATDKVVLWSGGLYNWFDPFTLIRAIHQLSHTHTDIRLYFQGTKHPHPGVPEMPVVAEAKELAGALGVLDTSVFFNDSWVPYADRQNYLAEADVGVSTHRSHIETTFSFRTRMLDYLWAKLPMVVTEGDYFGDLVTAKRLGASVPAEDVDALAAALEEMLYNEKSRTAAQKNLATVREEFVWPRVLAPLVGYLDDVARGSSAQPFAQTRPVRFSPHRPKPPRFRPADIGLALHRLFRGEFVSLWRALVRRLRPSGR
jgi:GT2 family glycosyltransferase/glycosyltransferase involved in cell wall biosynthesis